MSRSRGQREDLRRLAEQLAQGMTDKVIAGREGVSVRTIGQRVRQLKEVLGAETRFQAGYRFARLDRPARLEGSSSGNTAGENGPSGESSADLAWRYREEHRPSGGS